MASVNKVILIGNLTRDPEVRHLTNGTAVAKISLATNRTYLDQQQQKREETTYVEVEAWGKQAETIAKYVTKGRPLYVEGRLKLNQWEKDGVKHSRLTVVLEEFQFLGERRAGETADPAEPREPRGAPPARQPALAGMPKNDFADDDSVPF